MKLLALQKNFNKWAVDFDGQMTKVFKKKEKIIIGLNRGQLLAEGINVEGESLPEYSPVTVTIRRAKGLQTSHMDLSFTGAFQSRMFVNYKGDGIQIESQDYKENKLNKTYGQVLGLTDENIEGLIINQIIPQIINDLFK